MDNPKQIEQALQAMQAQGIQDEFWWRWVRQSAAALGIHLRPLIFYPLAINALISFVVFAAVFGLLMALLGRAINIESLFMGAAIYGILREVMREGHKRRSLPSWDSLSR